ncbi:YkvA family protein [Brachyspira hyodysenteriae]|uniref:YkvA family protein n=1 Tax=Brachyspira hyodysenteriae TaxID=159 RepID=UPI002B258A32|nr:YkvA family protein [Brachyspira hyodysenteriae]WPC37298.1 YkvA family protein [Brachyspira hyodysenteriae]
MGIKEKSKELWEKISLETTFEKLTSIIDKSKDILNLSSSRHLSRFLDKIQLMVDMIGDYINGNYKDIPWKSLSAIAGALIYLIFPLDVLPDLFPFIGLLDDAFIIGLCIKCFSTDLNQYKIWKYGELDEKAEEAEYEIVDDEDDYDEETEEDYRE